MSFQNQYSFADRLLHRLAFATPAAQVGLADLEERIFRRRLAGIEAVAPVFVTALPRAGTTILLEVLAGMAEFATHTYRDMPFLLCPLLWDRVAAPFRRPRPARERAHGDGILIGPDSPEAFEEILWRRFWPAQYGAEVIRPWARCDDPEFVAFLRAHMRKIIALRQRGSPHARRYASKNNLNIARLRALAQALPDATLVVLFREPLQHAHSLHRQHLRFGELHRRDPFARRYMAAIGHYDFGANLKPVDFDGWHARRSTADPQQLAFWVEYWIATYGAILRDADAARVRWLRFESLAQLELQQLAAVLGTEDHAGLRGAAVRLTPVAPVPVDFAAVPAELRDAARALHAELCARALGAPEPAIRRS